MENIDNEDKKSKRELLAERLKGRYPDKDFSEDESLYGQISDDYDDYDRKLSAYKEREGALNKMFSSDPRSASFLMAWKNGEHPMTALVRQFGKDALQELLENDEKMEEFAAANEEYLKRMADEAKLNEEYEKNLAESDRMLDEYQQRHGLSDEQMDEAFGVLVKIVSDGLVGKFTAESMDMVMKALSHDSDVEQAAGEAEVRGRNAKIEEKLRKPKGGDGMPNLGGSNNGASRHERRPMNVFDFAEAAQ